MQGFRQAVSITVSFVFVKFDLKIVSLGTWSTIQYLHIKFERKQDGEENIRVSGA